MVVNHAGNVTAGKLAKGRLSEQATLLNNATDAILIRDADNRILYRNRSAE